MASLTILSPAAYRCSIKVTPTKLLNEVLREACLELGYDFNRHDLAHRGKLLDGSTSFRLSGLSSNATLEIVPSKLDKSMPRSVDVAVQCSTGRSVLKVTNDRSLLEILQEAAKQIQGISLSDSADGVPTCTYMNQTVKGELQLKNATLMSLGVYSANAKVLIRYSEVKMTEEERSALVEQFNKQQAEIAAKVAKYEMKKEENEKRDDVIKKREQQYAEEEERKKLEAMRLAEMEANQQVSQENSSMTTTSASTEQNTTASTSSISITTSDSGSSSATVTSPSSSRIAYLESLLARVDSGALTEAEPVLPSQVEPMAQAQEYFPLLDFMFPSANPTPSTPQPQAKKARVEPETSPVTTCERNGVFFRLQQAAPTTSPQEEEDDGFFEVNVEDVKLMQKSLTQSVKAETDRALVSDQFVAEKNRERKQGAYKHSVVRFMLPNRIHLQANFISTEPTSALYTFVRDNVEITGSFNLVIPVACKVPETTTEDLIKKGIAPSATVIVRVGSGAAEVKEGVQEVTQKEADERSRQWLAQNTTYEPFNPVAADGSVQMRPVRTNEGNQTSYRNIPHTNQKSIPKWLQGKK